MTTIYDRVYLPGGHVAHLRTRLGFRRTLCGEPAPLNSEWLGDITTSTPAQREKARRLPVCKRCARKRDR